MTAEEHEGGVRGRALLIGAPLDGLDGIEQSVERMAGLLERRGFRVERLVGATARIAEVRQAMQGLLDSVQPGEPVVFYFAGHGLRSWEPDRPEVYSLLMTMDSWESTEDDPRALIDFQLEEWVTDLVRAAAHGGVANVTVILECCFAAGMVGDLEIDREQKIEALKAIGRDLGARARRKRRRERSTSLADVVYVFASSPLERAYGDGVGSNGGMTEALVDLVERYGHEPWSALEQRLIARVRERQKHQRSSVEGQVERVPFGTEEPCVIAGAIPCVPGADGYWDCAEAKLLAPRDGAIYRLVEEIDTVDGILARLELEQRRFCVLDVDDAPSDELRWAVLVDPMDGTNLCVEASGARRPSAELLRRLREAGVRVWKPGPRVEEVITLVLRSDDVVLCDRSGDAVARWDEEPPFDSLMAWLVQLAELERWLARGESLDDLAGAFTLSWGYWDCAGKEVEVADGGEVPEGVHAWFRCRNEGVEPRLFLSLFRVTGGRAIQQIASARLCTKKQPVRVGEGEARVTLARGQPGSVSVEEAIVAIVTTRPVALHLMERRGVRGPKASHGPKGSMVIGRFRLV